MTISPDGKTLWVMLQSATRQDGGASSSKRRMTRFLKYSLGKDDAGRGIDGHHKDKDEDDKLDISLEAEYVVPLSTYLNADNKTRVAAQSEIHYVSDTQFFVLARDSSSGRGYESLLSRYRHVDVVDISGATDIKGTFDGIRDGNITVGGVENPCTCNPQSPS